MGRQLTGMNTDGLDHQRTTVDAIGVAKPVPRPPKEYHDSGNGSVSEIRVRRPSG
jgi:hypothetical protein